MTIIPGQKILIEFEVDEIIIRKGDVTVFMSHKISENLVLNYPLINKEEFIRLATLSKKENESEPRI